MAEVWPIIGGRKLVKGYMTYPIREIVGDYLEVRVRHVALFEDGSVKITKGYVPMSCGDFNRDSFQWEAIPKLPFDLTYIGNYPADM
jgi:hypothetical protein